MKRLQDKKFGYVRVSSKDQNEERQIENMKYLGIEDRDIFIILAKKTPSSRSVKGHSPSE